MFINFNNKKHSQNAVLNYNGRPKGDCALRKDLIIVFSKQSGEICYFGPSDRIELRVRFSFEKNKKHTFLCAKYW